MAEQALLIMDVQQGVVERYAADSQTLLAALVRAVTSARAAGVPVIYVRIYFRPGAPEISRRNNSFSALSLEHMNDDDPSTQVHAAIAPMPGDIVVHKRRISAFSGSDLAIVLRSLAIDTLVLAGIATSGVVLSTLREAADLDYGLVVLSDGCADRDDEVHRVLMDKVFPRQATVLTTDEWVAQLTGSA